MTETKSKQTSIESDPVAASAGTAYCPIPRTAPSASINAALRAWAASPGLTAAGHRGALEQHVVINRDDIE